MAAPHVPRSLRCDRTLLDLRGAGATVSPVIDRPRVIAEPSRVRGADEVLTESALDFLAELHERSEAGRRELMWVREERQHPFGTGEMPSFPSETLEIRAA